MGFLDFFFGKKKENLKQKKKSSVGIAFGKDADFPTFAERYAETDDITFLHFDLWERIQKHYKNRKDLESYLEAKKLSYEMVSIAPKVASRMKEEYPDSSLPNHPGYRQLAIILEKEGQIKEAIEICETGNNEGWRNDFIKRIERLKKKL